MKTPSMERLLADVDAYLMKTGMAATTFGRKSVNDGKCLERLRKGGRAWPETVARIQSFMSQNPPARSHGDAA